MEPSNTAISGFVGAMILSIVLARWRKFHVTSATILKNDAKGLATAGDALRRGRLVAFPTETVYGLGANAFNAKACRDVFTTKGRPLTDPLIVHVTSPQWAQSLLTLSEIQTAAFELLAREFWPGPLTLVATASLKVFEPGAITVLTAGTGMVGVRVPADETARKLIDNAGVPVAAPSANRFGHVSPTSAAHVYADLGAFPIYIIDAAEKCSVGIESTVIGLGDVDTKSCVTLFRRGGVSDGELKSILEKLNLRLELAPSLVRDSKPKPEKEYVIPQIAPGQLLTHYAPDNVETFLWDQKSGSEDSLPHKLNETIVVDFGGSLSHLKNTALAYRDLSSSGNVDEACKTVFDVLRWTETIPNAKAVLLPNVVTVMKEGSALALDDRLYRAASGRRVGKIQM